MNPRAPLDGKVVLVTGGARRVGRTIALRLAEAGMDVAITYHTSGDAAHEVVNQIKAMGRRAEAIQADFTDPAATDEVTRQVTNRWPELYALINNASFFGPTPLGKITTDEYDRYMAVNARAPLMLTQSLAPMLAAHDIPGRIVNFIDIHIMGQPLSGFAAYNASKAALHEITMTCSIELAPNITVNAIAPGVVAWADSYSPEERRQYMKRVPLARPGTPEDAAAATVFLVRDADYCTGQIIRLDGGRLLT